MSPRGPSAASEPETRNVTWLLDQYPTVTDFIDVHSFGEKILYNWGDDDDQSMTSDDASAAVTVAGVTAENDDQNGD